MASQAALKYASNLNYGAGAAVGAEQYGETGIKRSDIPVARPSAEAIARAREHNALLEKQKYSLSLFSIVGAITVVIVMLFLVLAHISFTEVSNETLHLQNRLDQLLEQERKLVIEYERVFDLNEVEEYAISVLGMTKPDSDQIILSQTAPSDKTEIIAADESVNILGELGTFLSSLLEYFK